MKQPASKEAFPLDFARLERLRRPIDALVLPPGFEGAAVPDRESPVFPVSREALERLWDAIVANEARTTVLAWDRTLHQTQVRARSRVFGFPDFAWLQFFPRGENDSAVAIYSRSRHGLVDGGVNRNRVLRWLSLLEAAAAAGPR